MDSNTVNYNAIGIIYVLSFASTTPSATSYTLLAQPKCGTIQEDDGCICVDKDANITESAPANCSNSGTKCSCIP